MQCVPSSSGTDNDKPNILDWNSRPSCLLYQIYSTSTHSCVCIQQMYFDGSKCIECPKYCHGCSGPSNCHENDLNRDTVSGACVNGMFDDGYNCIPPNYSIFYKNNIVTVLPAVGTQTFESYQFSEIDLDWNGENPYLLSFSVALQKFTVSDYMQVLACVREGQEDVFKIIDKYAYSSKLHEICFYFYLSHLGCFQVEPTWVSIRLWTNFSEVTIAINNLGQTLQETIYINGLIRFDEPTICIGTCLPNYPPFSNFQGAIKDSLIFIKGKLPIIVKFNVYFAFQDLLNLQNDINDFFLQRENSVNIFLEFNSLNVIQGAILKAINVAANGALRFLEQTLTQQDLLKGFHFVQNSFGNLADIFQGKEFSLSFNLYLNNYHWQGLNLLTYQMNGFVITYSLMRIGIFKQESTLKICVSASCNISKLCVLSYYTPNYILIIMRDLEPKSLEATTYQFQVICNYSKDVLLFQNYKQNSSYDKSIIQIPADLNIETDYYVNNIRIFVGSDFYFDYSQRTNCFIYYDLSNIKCLKAKKNNAIFKGEVVLPSDCYKFGSLFKDVVYNKYTMECTSINSIIPGCMIYSDDLLTSKQCKDLNSLLLNDCLFTCKMGYFKSSLYEICKPCHFKCLSCHSYDQCTACKHSAAVPFDCNCILPQFRDPSTFECLDCSPQCQTCQENSNQCLTCSNYRLTPPMCSCDPTIYNLALSTLTACIPKVCSPQCQTCLEESSNCLICSANRIDPPACNCMSDYIEINNSCVFSKPHFFYNYNTSKIEECNYLCKECERNQDECTECAQGQTLLNSTCLCQDLSSFYLTPSGEIKCEEMSVWIKLEIENYQYYLIFAFEEVLDEIDFKDYLIDDLIYIYISSIDQQSFAVDSSVIKGKVLKLHIKFTQSFSAQNGSVLFLKNQQFVSSQAQKVLSYKYTYIPFSFKIGPLLISGDEWQANNSASTVLNSIKDQNESYLSLLRQSQVIFIFLNTLQPCIIFLMVEITIPPNLYQYLQILGLLVFPRVPDQQSTYWQEMQFSLFGLQQLEVSSNSSTEFQKLGFCNSMIANIPLVILSHLLWPLLLFITSVIMNVSLLNSSAQATLNKVRSFILGRINSNSETALLIISTAIFNQFLNLGSSSFLVRLSFYFAIAICILIIHLNCIQYQGLSLNKKSNPATITFFTLVEKYDFNNKPKRIKTFFFISVIKKYALSMIIVFLENYPSVLCGSCAALFLLQAIITIQVRPYKLQIRNLMKIGGEICMASAWIIFLIKFVPFQDNFKENAVIPSREVENFFFFGKITLWILASFNLIYLLDFIIFGVIAKAWNFGCLTQKNNNNKKQNKFEEKAYLQSKKLKQKEHKQRPITPFNG